ncbi:ATP-dependent DNA ligase [Vibrio phage 1.161.O._10N.261.48.C5]|nr:ATP-dependent DNA ligase [Vibrio phage 1.161.O._10N.261.48.C5]
MEKSIYTILEEVANTSSKNDKEAILKQYADNKVLKEVFRLTYSPTIKYYINAKTFPTGWEPADTDCTTWGKVFLFLRRISDREVTGHQAIHQLHSFLEGLNTEVASVMERIILGDLRCGVGTQTINKIWKGLIVKPPRQGAKGCSEDNLAKLAKKRKAIEMKADGAYLSYFSEFMTRSGMPVELEPLKLHLECGAFEGFAFEGEVIFDESKASREDNGIVNKFVQNTASEEEKDDAVYLVWDCIEGSCYKPKGVDKTPNHERRTALESMMSLYYTWCSDQNIPPKIKLIEREENVSMERAQEVFENYVRNGFEGAILKDMDAAWKAVDKPSHCVKMKRQDPADLLVVDIYEGTGKAKGSLGGVFLESSDGEIKTKAGSGFTDEQRRFYWDNPNDILGKVVEIEYEQVSMDSKTKQKSVTFPIFQKVRLDKMEADSYEDIKDKVRIK